MAGRAAPAFGCLALAPPPLAFATGAEASARGRRPRIGPARRPAARGNVQTSDQSGVCSIVLPLLRPPARCSSGTDGAGSGGSGLDSVVALSL